MPIIARRPAPNIDVKATVLRLLVPRALTLITPTTMVIVTVGPALSQAHPRRLREPLAPGPDQDQGTLLVRMRRLRRYIQILLGMTGCTIPFAGFRIFVLRLGVVRMVVDD